MKPTVPINAVLFSLQPITSERRGNNGASRLDDSIHHRLRPSTSCHSPHSLVRASHFLNIKTFREFHPSLIVPQILVDKILEALLLLRFSTNREI